MKTKFKLCKAKPTSREGVINFTLTTMDVDRDSEVLLPMGGKLDNFTNNPVFLWAHDLHQPPIGKVLTDTIQITDREITADVEFDLNDEFAKSIYEKYKNGFMNAGSIRFLPGEVGEPIIDGQRGVTFLTWELLEFSAVPVPANQNALVNRKGIDDAEFMELLKGFIDNDNFDQTPEGWVEYLEKTIGEEDDGDGKDADPSDDPDDDMAKGVVPFTATPTADIQRKWDKSAADKRLRSWAAGGGDFDLSKASVRNKYKKGFAYVDGDGTKLADYKLPHHDVDNGKLVVVWNGVRAAMAAVLGARGGVNAPDADRKKIYNHLVKHYKQFDKKPPEFKIVDDFINLIVGDVNENDAVAIVENEGMLGVANVLNTKIAESMFLAQYNLGQWEGVAKAMSDLVDADYLEPEEKEKTYRFLCVKYKEFGQEPPELKFEEQLDVEDELDVDTLLSDEQFIEKLTNAVLQNMNGDENG